MSDYLDLPQEIFEALCDAQDHAPDAVCIPDSE
jgi:hypothetical protein